MSERMHRMLFVLRVAAKMLRAFGDLRTAAMCDAVINDVNNDLRGRK